VIIEKTSEYKLSVNSTNSGKVIIVTFNSGSNIPNDRAISETLILGVNSILFSSPYSDSNWVFSSIPLCYDSSGNIVIPTITNRTNLGFDVEIGDSGTIECTCKHL